MRLPHVDPLRRPSVARQAWSAVGRTRFGRWFGIEVASRVDVFLLAHTAGRVRLVGPLPTALLGTTGARSGAPRANPVLYFHDGEDVVLVASSFGREHSPGWAYNALANPDVTLGGLPFRASPVTDHGDYERLFALATRVYPGFADYRRSAEGTGRHIPVLRLTATG